MKINRKFAFLSFMGCWALQLALQITVRNPLTVLFFAILYFAWVKIGQAKLRRNNLTKSGFAESAPPASDAQKVASFGALHRMLEFFIGMLCAFALTFFTYKRAIARFDSSLFRLLTIAILFVGFYCISLLVAELIFSLFVYDASGKLNVFISDTSKYSYDEGSSVDSSKLPTIPTVMVICLLFWLPYFLYEFPGIMTADSIVQYMQIIGEEPYSNHHPLIHTFTIGFFYRLGLFITHNNEIAISFYTVSQLVFLSFCCGCAVKELKNIIYNSENSFSMIPVIATLFYAIVPFNAVFAVTMWKDIPFAGITVLMACHVSKMLRKNSDCKISDFVLFAVIGIIFSLLRSNAWYAFVLWTPFFLYSFRKKFLQAIISTACVFVAVLVIKGPVLDYYDIPGPIFIEGPSVAVQQVARVLVEDREIDSESLALIDSVIDRTYIHELYAPDYYDNIKELVRAGHPEIIEENKTDFLKLWIKLGLRYPADYIRAWFDLVGAYIYPDVAYTVGNIDGIMPNDYGLCWSPILRGKFFIKFKEIMIKLGDFVPLYGMLWCIGSYTWALIASFIINILKKRSNLVNILMLLLVFTLLIAAPGPDFRYGYGIVLAMPLWAAALGQWRVKQT